MIGNDQKKQLRTWGGFHENVSQLIKNSKEKSSRRVIKQVYWVNLLTIVVYNEWLGQQKLELFVQDLRYNDCQTYRYMLSSTELGLQGRGLRQNGSSYTIRVEYDGSVLLVWCYHHGPEWCMDYFIILLNISNISKTNFNQTINPQLQQQDNMTMQF